MGSLISKIRKWDGINYIPQPSYAHVDVVVSGILLTGGRNERLASDVSVVHGSKQALNFTLVDFEHIEEGGGLAHSWKMTLFDKYWLDIETLLLFGSANVEMQMYYTTPGRSERIALSPVYLGVVMTWDPVLTPGGTLLTVECIGFLGAARNETAVFPGTLESSDIPEKLRDALLKPGAEAIPIAELVRRICRGDFDATDEIRKAKKKPWKAEVYNVKATKEYNDLFTDQQHNTQLVNAWKSDLQFLQYLATKTLPADDGSPIQVWMEGDTEKTLHFRSYNSYDPESVTRTFTYLYGVTNQEVIEFNPTLNIDIVSGSPAVDVTEYVNDTLTKKYSAVRASAKEKSKGSGGDEQPQAVLDSKTTTGGSGSASSVKKVVGSDVLLAKAAVEHLWYTYARLANAATLTYVGDGEDPVKVATTVAIIVLTTPDPVNNAIPSDRLIHPSSGIYRVERKVNAIKDGIWTTSLEMFRFGPLVDGSISNDKFMLNPKDSQVSITDVSLREGDVPKHAGHAHGDRPYVDTSKIGTFPPPVDCGKIGHQFDEPRATHDHNGVDIAAPSGTPLFSPIDGVVKTVGDQKGYGYCIEVVDSNGVSHFYAHLSEFPGGSDLPSGSSLQPGMSVKVGDPLGKTGGKGCDNISRKDNSTGSVLHYEIRVNGVPIDPAPHIPLPQDCK